jgi:hypothetical protein
MILKFITCTEMFEISYKLSILNVISYLSVPYVIYDQGVLGMIPKT